MARVLREQFGDEVPQTSLNPFEVAKSAKKELLDLSIPVRTANHLVRAVEARRLLAFGASDLGTIADGVLSQVRLMGPKSLSEVRQVIPYQEPNTRLRLPRRMHSSQ